MATHWGRVTHILNEAIIASDNGWLPDWDQAIIWTDVRIVLIRPRETNYNEILIKIQRYSRKCVWNYRVDNGHFVSPSMC